jgi:hypothetical protein
MATSRPATRLKRAEWFERRLQEHADEVARLREEFGDPQQALFAFTRDRLDRDSLLQAARTSGDLRATDWDDDNELNAW